MKISNRKWWLVINLVVILLSVPSIAMQFTNEVKWSVFDFVIMGILLLGVGLLLELVSRVVKSNGYRVLLFTSILLGFILVWTELAVGVFGTYFAGN